MDYMQLVVEKLKGKAIRETTKKNYLTVWRAFNSFLLRLDKVPETWEDRMTLFCAFLVEKGSQSMTVKSYMSAIKTLLKYDDYYLNENRLLLSTMMQACKKQNDRFRCRLPIQKGLFEMLLFEIDRVWPNQVYLIALYKAIFCLAYYGLMRVGELIQRDHPVKACDIHIGMNKDKIMLVLYTSKTHERGNHLQK